MSPVFLVFIINVLIQLLQRGGRRHQNLLKEYDSLITWRSSMVLVSEAGSDDRLSSLFLVTVQLFDLSVIIMLENWRGRQCFAPVLLKAGYGLFIYLENFLTCLLMSKILWRVATKQQRAGSQPIFIIGLACEGSVRNIDSTLLADMTVD